MERYGVVNPDAMSIEPGQIHLHMRTDTKKVNQGRCYFNMDSRTYFVKSKSKGKTEVEESVIIEVERYSGKAGDSSVEFYLTGE